MEIVLSWLPGYKYVDERLVSCGKALPVTMHVCRKTGKLVYYVQPLFGGKRGPGMFLGVDGVDDAIKRGVH